MTTTAGKASAKRAHAAKTERVASVRLPPMRVPAPEQHIEGLPLTVLLSFMESKTTAVHATRQEAEAAAALYFSGHARAALTVRSTLALAELAERRISVEQLFAVEDAGWLSRAETVLHVIPARTLTHRQQRQEPLSTEESDRLLRIARLSEQAVATFGDADQAKAWLRRANSRLKGKTPIEMADTEHGGRAVEELLVQIAEGMFV